MTLIGTQVRFYLLLGVAGFLVFGIAMHLTWISSLIWYYTAGPLPIRTSSSISNPIESASCVPLGIGMTQVGLAFHALGRGLGSRSFRATAIVSFLSAWWLSIASLLVFTGRVWTQLSIYYDYSYWVPGPLFFQYAVILLTGLALLGVALLAWPSVLVATRHLTRQRGLAVASGVLFLIAAHLVILPLPFTALQLFYQYPTYYFYPATYVFSGNLYAACVAEPASILAAILMYRSLGLKQLRE